MTERELDELRIGNALITEQNALLERNIRLLRERAQLANSDESILIVTDETFGGPIPVVVGD
jgi:hypothetical protein